MGFYYDKGDADQGEKPPGCLDTLIVIRVVLGLLVWPVIAIVGVFVFIGVLLWAYTVHAALALLPFGFGLLAVWAFARWDQRRNRPPGL